MSDQSPSIKGRLSRLGIAGWPLRRKVALALAVPLLLAAAFGGLRVTNDLEQSTNASASAEQVTIVKPAIAYLTAAEKGMVAAQSTVGTSQADLDDALVELKAAAKDLEKTRDESNLTFAQRQQVDVILDLSQTLRAEGNDPVSAGTWIAQLRQMQSGVTKLITEIINAQLTPEPRLELLSQALGGRFALAQQQALASREGSGRSVSIALFAEFGAERVALDRLAGQNGVGDSSIQTLRTNNGERARQDNSGNLGSTDAYDEYDKLQTSLLEAVDKDLAKTAAAAQNSALLNALLTLAALAAAIGLALLISRSLVNPIRRVREGALQVANQDLPDAVNRIRAGAEPGPIRRIDVTTHEEVGQLARAVDDLHQQAVTLASGEATLRTQVGEMFVTLSRRNTTLINQQLNLIEALESDEEDPKRLESLFRLDHLASRMRRTADSLLILADAPTRSAGWESVSIAETLQAATAGVSNYQRVRVESALATKVDESAAGDLVHLLTELVDNSLSYSSPNTNVTLASTTGENGVTITVSDAGLGIPLDELKVINDNLRLGVEVTPDTARRMGLFVVSRLAKRHGINVSLKTNRGDGMTAFVFVPNAILPERAHLELVPEEAEVEEVVEPVSEEPAYVEPIVEPEPVAIAPVAIAPLTVVPNAVEPTDDEPTDGEDDETDPLGLAPEPSEPELDTSDPLGIGDAYLKPVDQGLPTRQRGASLPHLASAGVNIPKKDADGNDEVVAPREMKRATGAMPLRSKRNLDIGAPAVSAVPDLPSDSESAESESAESPESDVQEAQVAEASVATDVDAPEVFDTPSALDEPAAYVVDESGVTESVETYEPESVEAYEPESVETYEPETFESAAPEPIEAYEPETFEPETVEPAAYEPETVEPAAYEPETVEPETFEPETFEPETFEPAAYEPETVEPDTFEPAAYEPAETETLQPAMLGSLDSAETAETVEVELAETVEPAKVEAAAANISALMAKIRPQRGRLPIPDYDDVDHAEILRGVGRDRSALNGAHAAPVETAPQPSYTSEPAPAFASTVVADAIAPQATEARRDEESSINGATKSSWLSSDEQDHTWTSTEVEAGWQRADTVAETHSESTSDAGLPVRQPGARLVPGSVSKPVGAGGRDPEAIRARLSAHKAGVRRGRITPVSADDQ
ncbi:sensor histidine kinase [Nocardioides sp.]|uniref:sensor histidine kinase n=1 Tax=Nocardioides sp. TaxID=35761 RepID=UPI002C4124C2|nr:ATP-binding protein [Nocardioides sp.]HXH78975.1 ATP-binding protein [Nocardioides sp.]